MIEIITREEYPMRKAINLLQRIRLSRPKHADEDANLSPFDRRLKMVSRARLVNHAALGRSVFRGRRTESEA